MSKTATRRKRTKSATRREGLLRWQFVRGSKVVTCEIRVNGRRAHDVCVLPQGDLSAAVVERYARPADALRRHAEIAWLLRETGWAVIRESAPSQPTAA